PMHAVGRCVTTSRVAEALTITNGTPMAHDLLLYQAPATTSGPNFALPMRPRATYARFLRRLSRHSTNRDRELLTGNICLRPMRRSGTRSVTIGAIYTCTISR